MEYIVMAENKNEKLRSDSAEFAENTELKNLEKVKTPERKATKAEIEKGEKDIAKKGEQAEKKIAAEREKRELDLAKAQEQAKREKGEKRDEDVKSPSQYTKKEKKQAYRKQIKKVQSQLPRGARTFSKIVHNPVIETVSDATAKTIFRPSALIGGSVTGLVFGLVIYLVARYYGYPISTMTLVLLLIVGAILGVIVELIIGMFKKPSQE
ncbi:MAG: hypothetical protein QG675_2 [Patescibacteria group bacterium]|nr:hypothetical protein [Patescibacteria group bacterium]MDQ5969814.1 hypothetical protein [Patescibacteria group bacterium]